MPQLLHCATRKRECPVIEIGVQIELQEIGESKMEPEIVQSHTRSEKAAQRLNRLLANEFLLRSKIRNYRWNLVGTQHRDLDQILMDQGRELDLMIEEVAAAINRQGESIAGSLTEALLAADLIEDQPAHGISPHDAVVDLAEGHLRLSRDLAADRASAKDASADKMGELFDQWSHRHLDMWATLRAIGDNRLRLQ